MSSKRVSRKELEHLKGRLTERDVEIVKSVQKYCYLTSLQISRLHWTDDLSAKTALRAAHRVLNKLRDASLIEPLDRRVGGVRGGSGTYVWSLGYVGARLLSDLDAGTVACKRYFEPSLNFLSHTLAVAEVALALTEAARHGVIADLAIESEPVSWRPYVASGGATARMKPDLAVMTVTGEYEDRWFIEVDLATEVPSRIVRKCLQYQDYRRSGEEQKRHGVFPAVVWIVPDEARKETLRSRIEAELPADIQLFTVITLNKLESLIAAGPDEFEQAGQASQGNRHA